MGEKPVMCVDASTHLHHVVRARLFRLCEKVSRFALCILPTFFLLFFAVLFFVWYLPGVSGWLAAAGVLLTCAMVAATVAFSVASSDINPRVTVSCATSPAWLRFDGGDGRSAPEHDETTPLRLVQMHTTHCSLSRHDALLFAVECFRADCHSCPQARLKPTRRFDPRARAALASTRRCTSRATAMSSRTRHLLLFYNRFRK